MTDSCCEEIVLETQNTVLEMVVEPQVIELSFTSPPGPEADNKVKVTIADTTPSYLASKIVAGDNVELVVIDVGGNEKLRINVDVPPGGVAWGAITGDISNQTDLQAALNQKYSVTNPAGYITSSALTPYLLSSQAASLYQPLAAVLTNTTASFTSAQETKLAGIQAGAEVNVNADWNASSGDAQILNKPTLLTPAGSDGSMQYKNSTALDATNYFHFEEADNRLEVFGGLGTEKLTNTVPTSAAAWTLASGWAFNGSIQAFQHSSDGTGTLSQSPALVLGEEYLVTVVALNLTVGSVTVALGGVTLGVISADGTYTFRAVPLSTAALTFTPTNTARLALKTFSVKKLQGGSVVTDSIGIGGPNYAPNTTKAMFNYSQSDITPGSTRVAAFNNAGSYTWFDFNFSGVNKSNLGVNSDGSLIYYHPQNSTVRMVNKNTGSNYFEMSYSQMGYQGSAFIAGTVVAGAVSGNGSTLESAGTFALKTKYVTASQALDSTAAKWIASAINATCTGTPSNACTTYTNSTDCNAREAHGGCSWFPGSPCSIFTGDPTACGEQAGCTVDTSSCAGAPDETACTNQNSPYGGDCSWTNDPQSCSGFDEATCTTTTGCSANYDYCSNYSDGGGDGAACASVSGYGCSYDTETGVCSGDPGMWFTSCGGSYDDYSCTGTYTTGVCSGSYGSACTGTPTCAGITNGTDCGNEAGCSYVTALNLTLPNIATCLYRDYWIKKDGASGTVYILPSAGDTVENESSLELTDDGDCVHVSGLRISANCNVLDESECGEEAGCSQIFSNCSWDGMECSGNAVCVGINDESTCTSTSYYDYCSGTYYPTRNWFIFGRC